MPSTIPNALEKYRGTISKKLVLAMKNETGDVGAYIVTPTCPDDPITYADRDGNELAIFSLFETRDAQERAQITVQGIERRYPFREHLGFLEPFRP